MNNEYIINGRANRGAIASAVRFRRLRRTGIENICAMPEVRSVFIGDNFSGKKRPKSEWNEAYLDLLHGTFNSCFNRDYLLYLDEVAEFVSKANPKKNVIRKMIKMIKTVVTNIPTVLVIAFVIIAGIFVYNSLIR
jgi:hypothetical protein